MMAFESHKHIVQCINNECVVFRSHRGLGFPSIVNKRDKTMMGVCFVIFWANCFVHRLKNYALKTSKYLEKLVSYYRLYVSFFTNAS